MTRILLLYIAVDEVAEKLDCEKDSGMADILHLLLVDDIVIECLGLLVKLFYQLIETIGDGLSWMFQIMDDLEYEDLIVSELFRFVRLGDLFRHLTAAQELSMRNIIRMHFKLVGADNGPDVLR